MIFFFFIYLAYSIAFFIKLALEILTECAKDEESVFAIGQAGGHNLLMKFLCDSDEEISEVYLSSFSIIYCSLHDRKVLNVLNVVHLTFPSVLYFQ